MLVPQSCLTLYNIMDYSPPGPLFMLMNQWKDEFKAHSRVKCPNAGCWLEFPSIYGLKYHYQRCQGVRDGSLGQGKPGAHPALAVGLGVSMCALSTRVPSQKG